MYAECVGGGIKWHCRLLTAVPNQRFKMTLLKKMFSVEQTGGRRATFISFKTVESIFTHWFGVYFKPPGGSRTQEVGGKKERV